MSNATLRRTVAAATLAVTGCLPESSPAPETSSTSPSPTTTAPTTAASTTTTTPAVTSTTPGSSGPGPAAPPPGLGRVGPVGPLTELRSGLTGAPWDLLRLDSGSTFLSRRDTGTIAELTVDGTVRDVATITTTTGNGRGVLGLAVLAGSPSHLYAFHSTAGDNRVSRATITGAPGSYGLGPLEPVLTGLPNGSFHAGGRIGFGPDSMLYVASGDGFDSSTAQDLTSRSGKILRLTPTGAVPADNPFPGSFVWSYGHRNIEGIGWGPDGRMWASEFGEDTTDELNLIQPGGNYGWPLREGTTGPSQPGFVDPVATWTVAEASPAGVTVVGSTVFVAALRGQRLLAVDVGVTPAVTTTHFAGTVGRIRDVTHGPGSTLWLLTSNSDGFGTPTAGDERLLSVPIA